METTVAETVCRIRERLEEKLGRQRFKTWFGDAAEFSLDDSHLAVAVANPFACSWIEVNYLPHIREAARDVTGVDVRVDVSVAAIDPPDDVRAMQPSPSLAASRTAVGASVPLPSTATSTSLAQTPKPDALRGDFSTFVVGSSNALAFAAAQTVARSLAAEFKPLVVYAGCGLGKTHLLHGIANAIQREHPEWTWRYLSGEEFTNEYVTAVRLGRVDAFRARFRRLDLLLIDDVHFLANKKATQEEFLHTFNAIDSRGKQIVMSSDRHPRSLAEMPEPVVSRLISGMVVQIAPPDFKTRREILLRRAALLRRDIPGDVLDFVARHVSSNVRELEGVLYKLVALSSLNKSPANIEMARLATEEILSRTNLPSLNVEIEHAVAQRFGVTRDMLHSEMRGQTVSLARSVAMFLIRRHTQMSFPEIGRSMGGKNHTTVLFAKRRIEKQLAADATVEWTTSAGKIEARLSEIVLGLEQQIERLRPCA